MGVPGQKINISPEERRRRSERAKALVEAGKLGGAGRGQGRARTKRATELLAETAAKHAEDMKNVFLDCMKPGNPPSIRMRAAELLAKFEAEQIAREDRDDDRLEGLTQAQLLEKLVPVFVRIIVSGAISMEQIGELVSRARKERVDALNAAPSAIVHDVEVDRVA